MLEELIGLILPPIISICELMGIFVVSLSAIQALLQGPGHPCASGREI